MLNIKKWKLLFTVYPDIFEKQVYKCGQILKKVKKKVYE